MAGQTVIVSVLADTRRFNSAMGGTDRTLRRFSDNLRRVNTVGLAVFTSLAIVVGRFTIDAINAADAAGAIDARLANTTKQMRLFGKATDDVVLRLQEFAFATEKAIAVDDDLIKQTQTVLLTFKNLAKTADQMGGAFDEATVLAFDLAATFGGDGVTNAKLLGKALNDPIRGVSSLSRVGVQFNDTQRAQIAAFVETNQLAKAQAVILGELQRQVGGNAEAGATAAQKLKTSFGNLQEVFGENILGQFADEIQILADELYKFTQTQEFDEFATSLGTAIKELAKELPQLLKDFGKFLKFLNDNDVSLIDLTKTFVAFNVVVTTLIASVTPLFALFQFFDSRKTLRKQASDQELLTRKTAAYKEIVEDLKGRQAEANKEMQIISRTMDDAREAVNLNILSTEEYAESMRDLNNQFGEQLNKAADLDDELKSVNKAWKEGTLNLQGFDVEVNKTNTSFTKLLTSLKPVGLVLGRVFVVISAILSIIPFAIGLFKGLGEALDNTFAGKNETINSIIAPFQALAILNTVLSQALGVDNAFKNIAVTFGGLGETLDKISEGLYDTFEGIGAALGRFIIDPLKEIKALWDAILYAQGQSQNKGGEDRFGGINPSSAPSPSPAAAPSAGLVVNVSALAPSPEIGRQVVAAIADYERTSGKRFA